MPGPYAHLTLLYELLTPARRTSPSGLDTWLEQSLTDHFEFCALGAVSPDYPNLAPVSEAMPQWADAMHGLRTGSMLHAGVRYLAGEPAGEIRDRQTAWFMGYCAHVAADVAIHPVVRAKVGDYASNQRLHRICEMHQDSHIYRRMNLGEIGESESFAMIVAGCSTSEDGQQLDPSICHIWQSMLTESYPELARQGVPDPTIWHQRFIERVQRSRARQKRYFPLADAISEKISEDYPLQAAVDRQFLDELEIPADPPLHLHYDEIFDHAVTCVALLWNRIAAAISDDNSHHGSFDDWDLDTGLDQTGRLVLWQH